MKFLISFCLFVVIGLSAEVFAKNFDYLYGKDEDACSSLGGRCILKDKCYNLAEESGLCPNQQAKGFECCYGAPKDENRCKKFGGECVKKSECADEPFLRGTDCGANEECCILD